MSVLPVVCLSSRPAGAAEVRILKVECPHQLQAEDGNIRDVSDTKRSSYPLSTQQELPFTDICMTATVRCDPHFPRSLNIAVSKRVEDIRSLELYHDCGLVRKEQKHFLISSWIVRKVNLVLTYMIRQVSG